MKAKIVRYKDENGDVIRSEFPVIIKSEMIRCEQLIKEKVQDGTFVETYEIDIKLNTNH